MRCESSASMRFACSPAPIVISPSVGRIMPEIARIVVVLPAPFEPISVTTDAFGTSIEIPCSTLTLAVARVQIPDR